MNVSGGRAREERNNEIGRGQVGGGGERDLWSSVVRCMCWHSMTKRKNGYRWPCAIELRQNSCTTAVNR